MKKAIEALFLVLLAIAAVYFVGTNVARENQQPSGGDQSGGTFEVEVLSLTVDPMQPMVGQSIRVIATLRNAGNASGTYEAKLKVDGEVKYTIPVEMMPGQIENVMFTGAIVTPGSHTIEVGGESVTITVIAPPGGATESWNATIRAPT